VGLVDHDEFRTIGAEALAGKVVIDTRGIWRLAASFRAP